MVIPTVYLSVSDLVTIPWYNHRVTSFPLFASEIYLPYTTE